MKNELKVGDILAGTWGYSMTIPCFYQVLKVTDKRIKVVELDKRMVRSTDGGYNQQGYEMPIVPYQPLCGLDGKEQLARPSKYGDAEWIVGSKYDRRYIEKWNGQPVWADYCD